MKSPTLVLICAFITACGAVGRADIVVPDFPPWWPNPNDEPDGVTRAEYHSFITDPDLNQPPDWTYDGFTPDGPDSWEGLEAAEYGQSFDPGGSPFVNSSGRLGDGIGALIPDTEGAFKTIGRKYWNLRWLPRKDIVDYIIWWGPAELRKVGIATDNPDDEISGTWEPFHDGQWHLAVLSATIKPQPEWEIIAWRFWVPERSLWYVDDKILGTNCSPEPTSGLLLGLGVLLLRRR